MGAWRQLRAIALLPGSVAILVPALILLGTDGPGVGWDLDGPPGAVTAALGLVLIGAGLGLWGWTLRLFARIGKGTLAPWDPTSRLVVAGPYRHVRNPMISAVLAVLLGEALMFGSPALLVWCAAFFAANHVFFLLVEEPGLERRFGEQYREYRQQVPRWVPRRTPWPQPRV